MHACDININVRSTCLISEIYTHEIYPLLVAISTTSMLYIGLAVRLYVFINYCTYFHSCSYGNYAVSITPMYSNVRQFVSVWFINYMIVSYSMCTECLGSRSNCTSPQGQPSSWVTLSSGIRLRRYALVAYHTSDILCTLTALVAYHTSDILCTLVAYHQWYPVYTNCSSCLPHQWYPVYTDCSSCLPHQWYPVYTDCSSCLPVISISCVHWLL